MKQIVSPGRGSGTTSPPGSLHRCSSAAGSHPASMYGCSFFMVTVDFTQLSRGAITAAVVRIESCGDGLEVKATRERGAAGELKE